MPFRKGVGKRSALQLYHCIQMETFCHILILSRSYCKLKSQEFLQTFGNLHNIRCYANESYRNGLFTSNGWVKKMHSMVITVAF